MAKAKDGDAFADFERACAELDAVREAHRANPDDAYLKLQYRSTQEAVQRLRSFWRGVDAAVEMGAADYGKPTGEGRRGGEYIHLDEPGA